MRREFTIQSKVDGLILDGLVVEPEEGVKRTALLQLSHGMSEYKERYLPFMEYMAEHGVVCVIHDHRGHGKSVKSEQDLGFMYGAGGVGLVEDLFLVTKWAKKEYPDLPFVLMGHSMGSGCAAHTRRTRPGAGCADCVRFAEQKLSAAAGGGCRTRGSGGARG